MNANIVSALGDKFIFTATGTGLGATTTVALFSGNYNTMGISNAVTQLSTSPFTVSAVTSTITYKSATALTAAGMSADYAMDDGELVSGLTFAANNSNFTIREFKNWIRQNSVILKTLIIAANNTDVYSQQITVYEGTNPFGKVRPAYINLNQFFSTGQYQDDKIIIENINLELNDQLVMLFDFKTSRTITFTLMF